LSQLDVKSLVQERAWDEVEPFNSKRKALDRLEYCMYELRAMVKEDMMRILGFAEGLERDMASLSEELKRVRKTFGEE
jgi:hypothetical protein